MSRILSSEPYTVWHLRWSPPEPAVVERRDPEPLCKPATPAPTCTDPWSDPACAAAWATYDWDSQPLAWCKT
jgi:hypothetical protein